MLEDLSRQLKESCFASVDARTSQSWINGHYRFLTRRFTYKNTRTPINNIVTYSTRRERFESQRASPSPELRFLDADRRIAETQAILDAWYYHGKERLTNADAREKHYKNADDFRTVLIPIFKEFGYTEAELNEMEASGEIRLHSDYLEEIQYTERSATKPDTLAQDRENDAVHQLKVMIRMLGMRGYAIELVNKNPALTDQQKISYTQSIRDNHKYKQCIGSLYHDAEEIKGETNVASVNKPAPELDRIIAIVALHQKLDELHGAGYVFDETKVRENIDALDKILGPIERWKNTQPTTLRQLFKTLGLKRPASTLREVLKFFIDDRKRVTELVSGLLKISTDTPADICDAAEVKCADRNEGTFFEQVSRIYKYSACPTAQLPQLYASRGLEDIFEYAKANQERIGISRNDVAKLSGLTAAIQNSINSAPFHHPLYPDAVVYTHPLFYNEQGEIIIVPDSYEDSTVTNYAYACGKIDAEEPWRDFIKQAMSDQTALTTHRKKAQRKEIAAHASGTMEFGRKILDSLAQTGVAMQAIGSVSAAFSKLLPDALQHAPTIVGSSGTLPTLIPMMQLALIYRSFPAAAAVLWNSYCVAMMIQKPEQASEWIAGLTAGNSVFQLVRYHEGSKDPTETLKYPVKWGRELLAPFKQVADLVQYTMTAVQQLPKNAWTTGNVLLDAARGASYQDADPMTQIQIGQAVNATNALIWGGLGASAALTMAIKAAFPDLDDNAVLFGVNLTLNMLQAAGGIAEARTADVPLWILSNGLQAVSRGIGSLPENLRNGTINDLSVAGLNLSFAFWAAAFQEHMAKKNLS
ncbi:MAG: hypothetical protein LW855_06400 [Alphaproteobacteria bacterium]|jgi:hypothetical protein|nr:hypothetical protein [Thalassospira sp.]MCE2965405.1 hypothetical protein [Alphaproteobacteria bacterium]